MATVELLNKPWQKFLAKFSEIQTFPVSEWKGVHLLAYICKRYKEKFDHEFILSCRGAPGKCTEMFFIKNTMASLGTHDPAIMKEYIDWIFDNKKTKFKTLGFFLTPGFGNEFKDQYHQKHKIDRATELPQAIKQAASSLNISASTYGDVAFIKLAVDKNPNSPSRTPYKEFLNHLSQTGFQFTILESLK